MLKLLYEGTENLIMWEQHQCSIRIPAYMYQKGQQRTVVHVCISSIQEAEASLKPDWTAVRLVFEQSSGI